MDYRNYNLPLEPKMHKDVRIAAANKEISMRAWIVEAIRKALGVNSNDTTFPQA